MCIYISTLMIILNFETAAEVLAIVIVLPKKFLPDIMNHTLKRYMKYDKCTCTIENYQ